MTTEGSRNEGTLVHSKCSKDKKEVRTSKFFLTIPTHWLFKSPLQSVGRGQQPSLSLQPAEESFPSTFLYFLQILFIESFSISNVWNQKETCYRRWWCLWQGVFGLYSLCRHLRETAAEDFSSNIDLFVDCFFERKVPRGGYHQPLLILVLGLWPAGDCPRSQSKHYTNSFSRSMYPPCLRTMLPTLRSMASTLNLLYGIQPDRRTTIVSDPSAIQTLT